MGRQSNGGRTKAGAVRAIEPDLDQIAHDLRTPLSAVLMWVRLLRAGAAPDPEAALQAIEKSAVELSRAIDLLSPASPPPDAPRNAAPAPGNAAPGARGNTAPAASGNRVRAARRRT